MHRYEFKNNQGIDQNQDLGTCIYPDSLFNISSGE